MTHLQLIGSNHILNLIRQSKQTQNIAHTTATATNSMRQSLMCQTKLINQTFEAQRTRLNEDASELLRGFDAIARIAGQAFRVGQILFPAGDRLGD